MDVVIEECIEDRYSDIEKKVDVVIEDRYSDIEKKVDVVIEDLFWGISVHTTAFWT